MGDREPFLPRPLRNRKIHKTVTRTAQKGPPSEEDKQRGPQTPIYCPEHGRGDRSAFTGLEAEPAETSLGP
jgi:hypothetical protein